MGTAIVAHPGRQHSYHTAEALKEAGILQKYITTIYNKDKGLLRLISFLIPSNMKAILRSRKSNSISDEDVLCFYGFHELYNIFIRRMAGNDKRLRMHYYDNFGKKVAKYVIKNHAVALIMYDTTAKAAFEYLKDNSPGVIRILDMSSANRAYILNVFQQESLKGSKIDTTKIDYSRREVLNKFIKEIELSDYFLVPSSYVARSLEYSGIAKDKMIVVPYGVDTLMFSSKERIPYKEGIIKFIFVGRISYAKGCNYLLEAFSHLPGNVVSLDLYGDTNVDKELYEKYKECEHIHFRGVIRHDQMPKAYSEAHVMIIPSLTEGMSLSGIEALSSGLPVICTTNSGVNDIVNDYQNGFTVEVGSSKAIEDKIVWFINNSDKINEMSISAAETGSCYSWERYKLELGSKIKEVIDMVSYR